jgi:hypothetical protein
MFEVIKGNVCRPRKPGWFLNNAHWKENFETETTKRQPAIYGVMCDHVVDGNHGRDGRAAPSPSPSAASAIVYFQTPKADEKLEMVLDSKIGELIGSSMLGNDKSGIFAK